jgi:hypothetical protein
MPIDIRYTDRSGRTYRAHCHDEATAVQRLAYLDEAERQTRKYAPTDTGATRFSYNEEAAAIRRAFPNL